MKSVTTLRVADIAMLGISVMLICLMYYFPKGYDHSVFLAGSKMILENGAIPYVDFIDTKPPIIFYIYSLGHLISSNTDISYRIVDILYQLLTVMLLYIFVKKLFNNTLIPVLSVLIYTVLYVGSGYYMTAQAESFASIPTILIAMVCLPDDKRSNRKTIVNSVFIGVLLAFLFFLKFTLIISYSGVMFYLLFIKDDSWKQKGTLLVITLLSFILCFVIYILYLDYYSGVSSFIEGVQWVSGYANITPLLSIYTIHDQYFIEFPKNLINACTPLLFIFLCIGIFHSTKGSHLVSTIKTKKTLHGILLFIIGGLIGVLYERKCMTYHYSRIYPMISIIISLGVLSAIPQIKSLFRIVVQPSNMSILKRLLFAIFLGTLLFYSPLTKLVSQTGRWAYVGITDARDLRSYYLDQDKQHASDWRKLHKMFGGEIQKTNDLFFWGNFVEIYNVFGVTPGARCLTNTPFVTNWTLSEWRDSLLAQIRTLNPRYFIVEQNDVHPEITSSTLDSYGHLLKWTELHKYVNEHYNGSIVVGDFLVYYKRSDML